MAARKVSRTALFGAGLVAGLGAAALLAGVFSSSDARAGVCRGNMGDYITSDATGRKLYVWSLTTNPPQVYAYDYEAGTFSHRDLSLPAKKAAPPEEDGKEGGKKGDKDVNVSGTIWTPEPGERVAIINGKTYREGDVFTTASGKRYKVVEIKPTNEVVYKEVE